MQSEMIDGVRTLPDGGEGEFQNATVQGDWDAGRWFSIAAHVSLEQLAPQGLQGEALRDQLVGLLQRASAAVPELTFELMVHDTEDD